MTEYIERKAALDIVKRTAGDYITAWSEIVKLPAADTAQVVHGQWAQCEEWPTCSICRAYACSRGGILPYKSPYCPNCGAKMDGGET